MPESLGADLALPGEAEEEDEEDTTAEQMESCESAGGGLWSSQ
jgi:hypothetical protein